MILLAQIQGKTEICVFHNNDPPTVSIRVDNIPVKSKKSINVLGVIFDCKLNWNDQIANAICKARKSLFALRLLKKYFNFNEMRSLLDSYFYSVLYYNSELWLTPEISSVMKQSLLSISANAIRSCLNVNYDLSFENLHKEAKKCTPKQIMLYKISLQLHRVLNSNDHQIKTETIRLFEQVICSRRQLTFELYRNNDLKIGMNTAGNKFYHINKLIGLDKLNLSFVHFKKLMKIQFLKNGKT